MKPSQRCIDLIKSEEGCVLHAYPDQGGKWTAGYGIIEYPDGTPVKKGDTLTQERADELLEWQVEIKSQSVCQIAMQTDFH
jgi:lysozyme